MRKTILLLFLILSVHAAAAETGSINLSDDKTINYDTSWSDTSGWNPNFTILLFNKSSYNYVSNFRVKPVSVAFNLTFESSPFTIVSGGTGTGIVWYDANTSYIYYVFDGNALITNYTVKLRANTRIFSNITVAYAAHYVFTTGACSPTDRTGCDPGGFPVLIYQETPASDNVRGMPGTYNDTKISTRGTDYYNVTYPGFGNLFQVNITKNPYLSSKYIFHGSSSVYGSETTYNNKSTTSGQEFTYTYNDGLYLNVTLPDGYFNNVLVNSTGISGYVPPASQVQPDPITGVGMMFDQTDYAIGDITNISWIRTSSTPFLDTDSIVLVHPGGAEEELSSSPPDSGYTKVLMSVAGTYRAEFRRSSILSGTSVLAYATATVGAETPSYIIAPAQVSIGKLFNVTYKIGWTVSQGATAWIRTYHFDDAAGGWENTYQSFSATGSTGIEANTTIILTKSGKYLIKLCDVLQGCKASTQTEAFFNGSEIVTNISASNITLDKNVYSYGETMIVKTAVDNFNWSNKQIVVEYYDADEALTQNQLYVQNQIATTPIYISDLTFSGSGGALMRLVGKNDTGNYILATAAFTLSAIDAEGYGLSIVGAPKCIGDTAQIKVISPAAEITNLSISADDAKYNKEYIVNGTKTIPYTFKISGTYYIALRQNGEAKRLIILNIGACETPPPPPPTTPGGSEIINTLIFLATNPIIWTIIITIALMVLVGGLTKPNSTLPVIVTAWASLAVAATFGAFPLWIPVGMLLIAIGLIAAKIIGLFNTSGGGQG